MTDTCESVFLIKSKLIKLIIILLLLAMISVGLVFLWGYKEKNKPVASVNGNDISRDDLYNLMFFNDCRANLDKLIINKLIIQEGKKLGIQVTDEEINKEMRLVIDLEFQGCENDFSVFLADRKMKVDEYIHNMILPTLTIRKIVAAEITGPTEIEMKEFFHHNKDLFFRVEARHIVVADEKTSWDIIGKLKNGEDFAMLAHKYSMDSKTRTRGGHMGIITEGTVPVEIEAALFGGAGLLPDPIVSSGFYHVIEVLNSNVKTITYDQVVDEIPQMMVDPWLIDSKIEELWMESVQDIKYLY